MPFVRSLLVAKGLDTGTGQKHPRPRTTTHPPPAMPSTHVAHDAVHFGLAVGSDVLAFSKSTPLLRPTVHLLEKPVCAVIRSKAGRRTLAAGDSLVSVADGTIDRAMKTGAYKCAARAIAHTYNAKVRPTAAAVRSTYTSTAAAATACRSRALDRYHAVLLRADALVDQYLPPCKAGKDSVKQPALLVKKRGVRGLATKVARRGQARVREAVARASLAVKNSPAAFKKTALAAAARVRAIPADLRAQSAVLGAALADRCVAAASAADRLALRYATTSFLRNLAVSVYQRRLSPLVARLLPSAGGPAPAPRRVTAAVQQPARSAPTPRRSAGGNSLLKRAVAGAAATPAPAAPALESTPAPEAAAATTAQEDDAENVAPAGLATPGPGTRSPDAAVAATPAPDDDACGSPVTPYTPLYLLNM